MKKENAEQILERMVAEGKLKRGRCHHPYNKRIKVEKDGITYKCMICREVYKLPGKVSSVE